MDTQTIILIIVFLIGLIVAYVIGRKAGAFQRDKYWEGELPAYRKDAILRSRAVLGGHFTENLAPYLPDFPYLPTECRFLGKPTDFIVFKGMDDKNIGEVIFVEVKSGRSKLSSQEKNLRETIEKKKVKFKEYRIPKELTDKKNIEEKLKHAVEEVIEGKEHLCTSCGRPIKHKGKCLVCNRKAKKKKKGRK